MLFVQCLIRAPLALLASCVGLLQDGERQTREVAHVHSIGG